VVGLMGYTETKAERDAMEHHEYEKWKAKQDADEFCIMKALLTETHEVLHKVLGVISDRDAAHGEISDLMRRIRENLGQ
jgi:hypothetical protein